MPEKRADLEALLWQVSVAPDVECTALALGDMIAEQVVAPGASADRAILYLHGGSYLQGSRNTHRDIAARLSRASSARVLLIDYRLAPENPLSAAVEDAVVGYRWLQSQGFEPSRLALVGDSAGGGLALLTLVALRDAGDVLPAAVACISAWTDLAGTGASMTGNASLDPFLDPESLKEEAALVLRGEDPTSSLVSPLYADLHGLPPLLLQVGSTEILLDDSTRLAERVRSAGVDVELQVWDDMVHAWPVFAAMIPDGRRAIDAIGEFLSRRMGQ